MAFMANSFGSVGRAVASDSIDPRFNSVHQQILFTINCIKSALKRPKLRKETGNGPFKTVAFIPFSLFNFGLVTTCYGQKAVYWRPACAGRNELVQETW